MRKRYSTYSDNELAEMMSSKKTRHDAFKEIYERYSSNVHAYCFKILNNHELAEDIFQETFIRFFKNFDSSQSNVNIPAFLIIIAKNLCLNAKRDAKNNIPFDDVEYLLKDTQNYENRELLELIDRALELLENDLKEPFVLREYSGMNYDEIAEICEISQVNARTRVFRAKRKIKDILKPYLKEIRETDG